jgi:hypothetical protein
MPSPIALDERQQEDEAAFRQEIAKVRHVLVLDRGMAYHDEAVKKLGLPH